MNRRLAAVVIILALSLPALAGCSATRAALAPSQPKTVIDIDPIIVPVAADITGVRMVIFNFRTNFRDPMADSHLAHQLHQFLLARRVCRVVEVMDEDYIELGQAIDRAKVLGYDLLALGQVQEAFYGGEVEPTKVTVELRIIDVVRRVTTWYLRGTAIDHPIPAYDYLVYRTDSQKAVPPMDLIRASLMGMSDVVAETGFLRPVAKPKAAPKPQAPAKAGSAAPNQAPAKPKAIEG